MKYQIVVADTDTDTVEAQDFFTDADNLIDALFEFECHMMSAYHDEIEGDDLMEELECLRNNIEQSTTIIANQAFRICDNEAGLVIAKLAE